jgi:ATP/maltotriose-dependent transcriptional regulator MalT
VDVAKVAGAGPPAAPPARAVDRLLDGLVIRYTRGWAAAVAPLRRALEDVPRTGAGEGNGRWRWLAGLVAAELWDDGTWDTQTSLAVALARRTGALTDLPAALDARAVAALRFGDSTAAERLIEEAGHVSTATDARPAAHAALLRAAWAGDGDLALSLIRSARRDAFDRGEGRTLTTASLAAAVLLNGRGRYDEALVAARDAIETEDLGLLGWALAELVEAAVRAGEPGTAAVALDRLAARTRAAGTDWALGVEARARALVGETGQVEELFREAIHRLGRTRVAGDLARAQLAYGEWLRRQGRRTDAREQLRAAREALTGMGAAAFAERAHRELLATGEKVRPRSPGEAAHLTAQEARVAFLARDGLSNPAIGARLFVSPRTVEYHLHKVFAKLGIASRGELHLVLPAAAPSSPRNPDQAEPLP